MNLRDRLIWAYISKTDIETERKECIEEGKDISLLEDEFRTYSREEVSQSTLEAFLEKTYSLPTDADEPGDFEEIISQCEGCEDYRTPPCDLENKIAGAWIGRIAGCELGKPFEGTKKANIENYLKSTDSYPLSYYINYDKECAEKYGTNQNPIFYFEKMDRAYSDDDLNYPALNLKIYKDTQGKPKAHDIAMGWLSCLPFTAVCTAERVAYKNFMKCIDPPMSATVHNPYREWIGAQIRGDFWGWVNPVSPKKAAELAFNDACISHVKNGIYGEMFVASMLSHAFHQTNIKDVITKGLAFVPKTSRLYKGVCDIINLYDAGKTYEESIEFIHSVWNEYISHDWCHTIPNAQIVVSALLWAGDFGDAVCKAAAVGFDTDCNGATAGSIMGLFLGKDRIDPKWYEPFNDTLQTDIAGYNNMKISDMIKETIDLAKKNIII